MYFNNRILGCFLIFNINFITRTIVDFQIQLFILMEPNKISVNRISNLQTEQLSKIWKGSEAYQQHKKRKLIKRITENYTELEPLIQESVLKHERWLFTRKYTKNVKLWLKEIQRNENQKIPFQIGGNVFVGTLGIPIGCKVEPRSISVKVLESDFKPIDLEITVEKLTFNRKTSEAFRWIFIYSDKNTWTCKLDHAALFDIKNWPYKPVIEDASILFPEEIGNGVFV
jgi:hypothetical protein